MLVKNQKERIGGNGFLLSFCSLSVMICFLFLAGTSYAQAVQGNQQQVSELNESLKNVIEQNQKLITQNKNLQDEIQQLKDMNIQTESRLKALQGDRETMESAIKKTKSENRDYVNQIKKLESDLKQLQDANEKYGQITKRLEEELLVQQGWQDGDKDGTASMDKEEIVKKEAETLDLLSKIDAFAETDENLRKDAAKAHYNMGNIYFKKGEYEIAFREYYQAVTLMPNDPDSHYNLAYVSGEFLEDYKTALKHYQLYLYLKPNAKDANLVKEKIIEARLILKSRVESPLEKKD